MEVSGIDLFNQAKDMLINNKELEKAGHYFNLLLNHTIKDKKNSDVLLFHLAAVYMKLGYRALSLFLFKEAMKYRENFIEAYNNIGYIYKKEQMDEAQGYFEKALELANKYPDHVNPKEKAEYLTNIGSMYIANGTPNKAIEYFDQASKVFDENAMNKWNRSLVYLELGDYEKGWSEYDFGERQERLLNRTYGIESLPVWDGVPDKNKTVVVLAEQGLGDEIMFASILPDMMKDCNVILEAHPRLADLFRLNFPTIPVFGTRKAEKITWPPYHKIDAKIGLGSLGKFYRKNKEDFPGTPYLIADPKRSEKYKKKFSEMGDKPKIGVSWRGGTKETGKNNRTVPLDMWKEIFKFDFDFISLQYDKEAGCEVKDFEEKNGICLNHWQETLDDYDETAALVSNLDLIISVPQSVVHLAGALGTPTWQLAPFKALWQVGAYGEDAPWYQSVKNFWQDASCEWKPVMEKIKEELCNLLQTNIES